MTHRDLAPIACTLDPNDLPHRIAWIGSLMDKALLRNERHGHVLDLWFAPHAEDDVRELVRREQACCVFLAFRIEGDPEAVRVTITVPPQAGNAADLLFEYFIRPRDGTSR